MAEWRLWAVRHDSPRCYSAMGMDVFDITKVFPMALRKRNQVPKGKHGGWQLVLTEDVQFLGKQGETVEVKPGYARNYLLPMGLGTIPTAHNLKQIEFFKKRIEKARLAKIEDLRGLGRADCSSRHYHDRSKRKRRRPPLRFGEPAGYLEGPQGQEPEGGSRNGSPARLDQRVWLVRNRPWARLRNRLQD